MSKIEALASISDCFLEYLSNLEVELMNRNDDYKGMFRENFDLQEENEKVRKIFEFTNPKELNEKDCEILIRILDNLLNMKFIEQQNLFLQGSVQTISLLKQVGLINYTNEEKVNNILRNLMKDI